MSRIADTFANLKAKGEKALVLFVTAGDPALDQLVPILEALAEGGADVIEVGLPFSDPIADGPSIQASSFRALERGTTTSEVFVALARFQGPPVVLMGYMNSILSMGMDNFASAASQAGVSGTIVCDLTPDEAGEWVEASQRHGLDTIFLAAPTSTDERLELVCRSSTGFVYAVSKAGVTGTGAEVSPDVASLVARLRPRTDAPVCVGFGISNPDHVRTVCRVADGAVIGSLMVETLNATWDGGRGREAVVEMVRRLKDATR